MRAWAFGAFAVLLALMGAAKAQDTPEAQAIVSRQIAAFANDDAKAAFAFAAPEIQDKFGDADSFMAMVKRIYPPVYRHRSIEFGKQTRDGEEVEQDVVFVDGDNDVWVGVYKLKLQPCGEWRITACVLIPTTQTGL
jgi:hypothetical protein